MRLGRALVLVCGLASGCDRLFALTHVPDPPADAYEPDTPDAAPPCRVNDVAVGQRHACAIDTIGDVYCWGLNDSGQVQPGGPERVLVPTKVSLPPGATEIELGKEDSCARVGGDVYCWGNNDRGQLGKGSSDTSTTVRKIDGIPASAQLAVGGGHVCSLSAGDGTIWCWGRNSRGQTGVSTGVETCFNQPCVLPGQAFSISGAKRVVTGHNSTCYIDASDQLWCWGRNREGQLGIGSSNNDIAVQTLVAFNQPIVDVDFAGKSMCAIDAMQRTWCTGDNAFGQLGNGGFQSSSTPVQIFVTKPKQLAMNGFGSCAITEANALSCWGLIDPGNGKPGTYAFPNESLVRDLTKLSGHYYAYCGIANGGVLCWGSNADGELGRGARGVSFVPQSVGVDDPISVAVGESHGCAVSGGIVKCWGANDFGQAGDNVSLLYKLTPTPVTLPVTTPKFVAAFEYKTCAWGGGQAACWGRAANEGLGTGTSARALAPSSILASNVMDSEQAIAFGWDHLCAIDNNSALSCYGDGGSGQLGDSTGADRPNGAFNVLMMVDQVAAGRAHTCARTITGVMYCWGANAEGQVGDNSQTNALSPKIVIGTGSVVKIGLGELHSCALNTLGEVWCWGDNSSDQLGKPALQRALAPQRVIDSGATDLSVGAQSTCAKVNGSWMCWGRNDKGQLASMTGDALEIPTTIQPFAGATKVVTGNQLACTMTASDVACAGYIPTLGTGDTSESVPKAPMLPGCQ